MTDLFPDSLSHILSELERVDLLIGIAVRRAQQFVDRDDRFQGLYITDEEVARLLANPTGLPRWAVEAAGHADELEALREIANSNRLRADATESSGIRLRMLELSRLFELKHLECDVVLVAVASELDLRYERLFGYLHDDVTRKRPSVDLALNLLCPTFGEKLTANSIFVEQAPLVRHELIRVFEESSQSSGGSLARCFEVNPRVLRFLLDSDEPDHRIASLATLVAPDTTTGPIPFAGDVIERMNSIIDGEQRGTMLYLQGPAGIGKRRLAQMLCGRIGVPLLHVETASVMQAGGNAVTTIRRLRREAILQRASIYWSGFDCLLESEHELLLSELLRNRDRSTCVEFASGDTTWEPAEPLADSAFLRVELGRPTSQQRHEIWTNCLGDDIPCSEDVDTAELASRFRLSWEQIEGAAATAANLARVRNPDAVLVTQADLNAGCRLHSNRKLAELAQKLEPHYTWDDIVLPDAPTQLLHDVCNTMKHRARVYEEWGFGSKLSLGKGLSVLFSGPPGTGKTMAAEVIASDLDLDLYRIDLSTVVSKYIGETEKNLSQIFAEAEHSNAILFFDEADALFGKRSEVRDSHDRYANIETGYLLQRMEAYEGIVILATNLRGNLDDAFERRLQFIVDFPFPDAKNRHEIWQRLWPRETPLSDEIDFDYLASQFEIAGGNIKNIGLAASFLAAQDEANVRMPHLVQAARRELQKMGRVVSDRDFELHTS